MKTNKIQILLVTVFLMGCTSVQAQYKWENPMKQNIPVVRGQGWGAELKDSYVRLPQRAQKVVRQAVWDLSRQSAGLSVSFYSNAPELKVRYVVTGGISMPHMPATGVSGVDLYATDCHGRARWCGGRYAFGDTITYHFGQLSYENIHQEGYEYELFLPLYNSISWMEIGTPANTSFRFIPPSQEKPLVIYGTSIAQGACASRPGMAWSNILNRRLNHPVVNLGFSGNGKMEIELFDLLSEIDAKMYIIDCMPNLPGKTASALIYDRTLQGIKRLREKRKAPILLVEHSGYTNDGTSKTTEESYRVANKELRRAYEALAKEGTSEIYYLTKEEIGLSMDAMVEGVHPSDLGMQQYADSYIRKVKEVLHEESGELSTLIPCKQRREPNSYEWNERHEQVLRINKDNAPEIVMIGNSITHYWAGEPISKNQSGKQAWNNLFAGRVVHNLGFGWDRIENVLWRVYHGELDGYDAKSIFVMIGTNNLECNTDKEIAEGIVRLTKAITWRQPKAKFHIIGILPRKDQEARVRKVNAEIKKQLASTGAIYIDLSSQLVNSKGVIDLSLFTDGLHPNEKGYECIAKKLITYL